jgi:hypothetical protein
MCVTEVKNLHDPVALTKIEFGRWNHNKAISPELYKFAAELSDLDDPLSDLTPKQVASVNALIDDLPEWKRPSRQIRTLPGGRRLSAKVRDEAHSVIVTHLEGLRLFISLSFPHFAIILTHTNETPIRRPRFNGDRLNSTFQTVETRPNRSLRCFE